ncbi:hypothetical protein BEL04_01260 [Mucilaginibacter sp. PPCGB 2223]|uniref:hypothetical protein n=1 Tax=Mucilaginibacter sp. PPCGB 2223 TaxID=1886027 RepID=UPI0008267213|nr:hypothetical protein [Mucilaginibacter sp. PPCGB 2223]OCX52985.1 hypothetical protein BEL04_01260 [Mucilaginibacter sp. PPCGB 2223]
MNDRNISLMWVSLDARNTWHNKFASLRKSLLASTLIGVHEGRWQSRSLNLYGHLWGTFLSMAKTFEVAYTSQTVACRSSPSRVCNRVYLTNVYAEPDQKQQQNDALRAPTIWDIAKNSPQSRFKTPALIEHDQTLNSLLLWEDMGLSLFAHAPQNLSCSDNAQLLENHLNWMQCNGYAADAGVLSEVLSWPVEWSSCHGIEEFRTPLFKLQATNWARPYHQKYSVQILGDRYPAEGVTGLSFPYQQKGFKPVSDSASFKKGIIHNTSAKC